jgi:hypothetical protein
LKVCGSCKKEKNIDLFKFDKSIMSYKSYCLECAANFNRAWRNTNPDKAKCNSRLARYKYIYDVSFAEIQGIIYKQKNKCAICENILIKPQVDHCHITGKVRGVLCPNCNTAIGKLHDNTTLLERAIKYLKESN